MEIYFLFLIAGQKSIDVMKDARRKLVTFVLSLTK